MPSLPADDVRHTLLSALAERHRQIGQIDAFHEEYMVAHWAPSFALYLLTGRGLPVRTHLAGTDGPLQDDLSR